MTGERSYTTKIWRPPSLIGFSSADALSTSMDPPGEPVISTWKRPCQKIQNGSEFPELVAQNSRNPQPVARCGYWRSRFWSDRPCSASIGTICGLGFNCLRQLPLVFRYKLLRDQDFPPRFSCVQVLMTKTIALGLLVNTYCARNGKTTCRIGLRRRRRGRGVFCGR